MIKYLSQNYRSSDEGAMRDVRIDVSIMKILLEADLSLPRLPAQCPASSV
jgi:hypothetical protein